MFTPLLRFVATTRHNTTRLPSSGSFKTEGDVIPQDPSECLLCTQIGIPIQCKWEVTSQRRTGATMVSDVYYGLILLKRVFDGFKSIIVTVAGLVSALGTRYLVTYCWSLLFDTYERPPFSTEVTTDGVNDRTAERPRRPSFFRMLKFKRCTILRPRLLAGLCCVCKCLDQKGEEVSDLESLSIVLRVICSTDIPLHSKQAERLSRLLGR